MDFLKNLSGSTVSRSAELLADDGYAVHDHDAAGGGTVCVALLAGGEDYCQFVGLGGVVVLDVLHVDGELGELSGAGCLEAAGGAYLLRCVDIRAVEGLVLAGDLVEYCVDSAEVLLVYDLAVLVMECISAIR